MLERDQEAVDDDVDDDETDVDVFIVVVLDGRLILLQKACYLLVFRDQEAVDDDNVCVIVFITISTDRN